MLLMLPQKNHLFSGKHKFYNVVVDGTHTLALLVFIGDNLRYLDRNARRKRQWEII